MQVLEETVKGNVFQELLAGRTKLAVVGLGYVGMPLLFGFAEHAQVIGYDISQNKVAQCKLGPDNRPDFASILENGSMVCTNDPRELSKARAIIIAVPTPVYEDNTPDMRILESVSELVGRNLSPGTVIAYESTVYPGATEEVCIPILEKASGLVAGRDFKVGYSPERINPGDKVNKLETIVKIVSGMDKETTDLLMQIYGLVAKGGLFRASSIKVAEAAKVAENAQRDINIAFVNELSMIFHRMDIDTLEVVEAMNSKWNALGFRPGLVGGHCIGVDPFYLTHKAEQLGYHSRIILAGRQLNDSVGAFVAEETVKLLSRIDKPLRKVRVAVLGFSFKENSEDTRNTKVDDIITALEGFGISPLLHDPHANPEDVMHEYGRSLSPQGDIVDMDCLILAVGHDAFRQMDLAGWKKMFAKDGPRILIDVKGIVPKEVREALTGAYWRL